MKKLNELTVMGAINALKRRQCSSEELVTACFNQIEKYDSKIKAFVLLTKESALERSRIADDLIKNQGENAFIEKPLLGIPYACKDNFSTKDVQTTAASNMLIGYYPPYESTVTTKLTDAGAIMLGKTNMDAFAHGSSTEASDFFTTRNPWNTRRLPGGSSGGSAAAVASNMCVFAIGSETAGSIRGPAAWCGVTGFKPTYGRVSRYGVVAMASSTDSPGPVAKNIRDAAYVLKIVAGKDAFDATTSPLPADNYYESTKKCSLKGVRIGKPKSYFEIQLENDVKVLVEKAVQKFAELGAEIVDVDLMDPKYSIAVYTILQRSEVSSNLARLDGIRYGQGRSHFGFEAKKRMMLGAYALSSGYYDAYYAKAQKVRTLIVNDFNKVFSKVDLIIGPTMPCVAMEVGSTEESPMFGELMDVLAEPSSIAGLPGISVTCGFSNNLPVGVQVIGPAFSELKLVEAVTVYQNSTAFHVKFADMEKIK